MKKKVKLTIQLPEELRKRAKIAAAQSGKPTAEVLREALEVRIALVESEAELARREAEETPP